MKMKLLRLIMLCCSLTFGLCDDAVAQDEAEDSESAKSRFAYVAGKCRDLRFAVFLLSSDESQIAEYYLDIGRTTGLIYWS